MGGRWLSARRCRNGAGGRWSYGRCAINEYAALGIDSFVLSGYPHLEEAYRVGELLFPHLDVAIPEIPRRSRSIRKAKAVANDFIPRKVAQS
ncbi:hypothetical protein ACLK11_05345 [Escherichia coli]